MSTSLIGNANSSNFGIFNVLDSFFDTFNGVGPYFEWIMLYVTRRWIVLLMLDLMRRDDLTIIIEDHAARTARSLVY